MFLVIIIKSSIEKILYFREPKQNGVNHPEATYRG